MHNRLLHGWGVVCGADICYVSKKNGNQAQEVEPWVVMVTPGYVLGPYGDEIYIDCKRKLDLRTRGVVGVTGETCVDEPDVWCSEVLDTPDPSKLFIAVRYKQVATRPVRVQPGGCGCDDSRCENSRWRDGYEIGILTECPDADAEPPTLADLFTGERPDCAPCPEQPWVVLGSVTVDADGKVNPIDTCDCRRLAASFMNFWWACTTRVAPDEGRNLTAEEERRLKGFAKELMDQPGTLGYIISYGQFEKEGVERAKRAMDLVVSSHGVDPSRVRVIDGGCRKQPRIDLKVQPEAEAPPEKLVDADTIACGPRPIHRAPEPAREDARPVTDQPDAEGGGTARPRPKKPGKRKER